MKWRVNRCTFHAKRSSFGLCPVSPHCPYSIGSQYLKTPLTWPSAAQVRNVESVSAYTWKILLWWPGENFCSSRPECKVARTWLGLAKLYTHRIYGVYTIFSAGKQTTIHTIIYGVHIRFRPTLHVIANTLDNLQASFERLLCISYGVRKWLGLKLFLLLTSVPDCQDQTRIERSSLPDSSCLPSALHDAALTHPRWPSSVRSSLWRACMC